MSEFSDFHTAVTQDYMHKKAEYAVQRISRSDAQIYYIIAQGDSSLVTDVDKDATKENGYANVFTLADLGLQDKNLNLKGEYFYLITDDKNVDGWKQDKKYFDATEKHYISDKGEVIVTPGYMVEDGSTKKWYIAENVYYESDSPIRGPKTIVVNGYKVVDSSGNEKAAKSVEYNSSNKLYIQIDATVDGGNVTYKVGEDTTEYAINQKYEVNKNGTFEFTLKSSVEGVNDLPYTVTVNQFDIPTLADKLNETEAVNRLQIGDWIDYKPTASNRFSTTVATAGVVQTDIQPDLANKWRVWDIKDGKIIITPCYTSNPPTLTLSGVNGYLNCVKTLNDACKTLYVNKDLGVNSGDIWSMTIEDLEGTNGTKVKVGYDKTTYASSYSSTGKYGGYREYGSGTFYTYEKDGVTVTNPSGEKASSTNKIKVKHTDYGYSGSLIGWKTAENAKLGGTVSYGDILNFNNYTSYGWLASLCVGLDSSRAYFSARYVGSGTLGCTSTMSSAGNFKSPSNGLRPLVSLSSELSVFGGDGKTNGSAWKLVD